MKFLNNFSGGLCSFWSSHRLIQRHGKDAVVNIFADTLEENADLYDFNRRSEDLLGIPLTRISLEISPWELFRREGLIANDRFPICSTKLKREPLNAWMESHYEMTDGQANAFYGPGTVALGFDWNEGHRVQDFKNAHPEWRVVAPMQDEPIWDKCKMIAEAEKLGLKTNSLYSIGFPHANCGGACVKAGISHFVHLYNVLPATFWRWAAEEQFTQQHMRAKGVTSWEFTILKDRRGGETRPLSLVELAHRIQSGEKFPKTEWGGCGCGGATTCVM